VTATAGGPPAATLRAFADELVRAGVRDAVVCPGSRSTPMALALAAHPGIAVHVHLDERSGSFFALGAAKASRRPVAFLATSGTAVVNAHPAVVEASHGRVPLVVLTADRPPELRDRGAPQTIDQAHLYGGAVKWFVDMPVPEAGAAAEAFWRASASRAVAVAAEAPAGPVHVNLPFREPLIPDGELAPDRPADPGPGAGEGHVRSAALSTTDMPALVPARPFYSLATGRRRLEPGALAAIAAELASAHRPLIACGPSDDPALPAAIARLAAAMGAPILADPLSGVRLGPHDRSRVVAHGDLLVRHGPWIAAHEPDLVVRFGAPLTSKPLGGLIAASRPAHVVLDGGDGWLEPHLVPTTVVHADPAATAADLARLLSGGTGDAGGAEGSGAAAVSGEVDDDAAAGRPSADPSWCPAWLAADAAAARAIDAAIAAIDEPYEGRVAAALADALPDGALLWAGSSMPVRDLDAYLPSGPAAVRVLSNRGVNGIDGVLSSALGAASMHAGPTLLVLGDVSFLHDIGGLLGGRAPGASLTVLLVDNDGGGIFSFLPQATADVPGAGLPARYEALFGTPHGMGPRLGPVVTAYGGRWIDLGARPWGSADADRAGVAAAVRTSLGTPGVTVIRYATGRARNVELHRLVATRVAAALVDPPAPGDPVAGGATIVPAVRSDREATT
jgi:2-succinyl-5-enolpyruvyl-6-hydroxy-3-cyclohexene-1-carboxylate synthase